MINIISGEGHLKHPCLLLININMDIDPWTDLNYKKISHCWDVDEFTVLECSSLILGANLLYCVANLIV